MPAAYLPGPALNGLVGAVLSLGYMTTVVEIGCGGGLSGALHQSEVSIEQPRTVSRPRRCILADSSGGSPLRRSPCHTDG
jgi:hypothetical protein